MPQGKCAFCGTFVTGGGTAMGKHSVACTACTPLALKWLEQHGEKPVAEPEAETAAPAKE
ncbi:MAG: hypothetical protein EPO22_06835 [Dehalococcoidia bacterium]|nr:MAG: hypothetical protein EPO22_06835 [Dehalococcoidia bacterium]